MENDIFRKGEQRALKLLNCRFSPGTSYTVIQAAQNVKEPVYKKNEPNPKYPNPNPNSGIYTNKQQYVKIEYI